MQLFTQPKKLQKESLISIQTHDLCDASAVLYQLSYQANWELVILWVQNKYTSEGWINEFEDMKHIFDLRVKD